MSDKVQVSFRVSVKGFMGASFEMDRSVYDSIRERWEKRGRAYEETELAHELVDYCPFDLWRYLNIDDMEIEDLQAGDVSAAQTPEAEQPE